VLRYAAALFLGAFLLFQVQPIIARCILPWFGGTPSVWTTCMLFFQVLLVLGYAYAHLVATKIQPRTQAAIHWTLLLVTLGLLGIMTAAWGAPIVPSADWKPQGSAWPMWNVVRILAVTVGLPYLALATTSPLMQAWFTRTEPGISPYRLYSLSNLGSLLGLLTYPFLVEPALAQRQQGTLWAAGFVLFSLGCAVCAWRMWRTKPPVQATVATESVGDEVPPGRVRGAWIALPALAAVLLLAVTNHLCQDVAVTPFLWVVPLSLYLLSFIICFDHERWYWRPFFVPALVLVGLAALWLLGHLRTVDLPFKIVLHVNVPVQIVLYSAALFIACMVCHGELVSLKPKPRYLTSFYLSVAIGGAIGGILVGLVAPLVFSAYTELPVALVACLIVGTLTPGLRGVTLPRWAYWGRLLLTGLVIGVVIALKLTPTTEKDTRVIARSRNFYGLLRVEQRNSGTPDAVNVLMHGRIIHGFQVLAPSQRRVPTSYYGPKSGAALAISNHPRRVSGADGDHALRIGVAGLGAGTIAAFAEREDAVTFYEINPDVPRFARNPQLFTYLSDCPGKVVIVMGDARLSLERELARNGSDQYDLILLDAFSGDAVPAHLLTREAFAMYVKHLRRPHGALVVDVSNAVLDLPPVIWKVAHELRLDCALVSSYEGKPYWYNADWMVLTPERNYLRDVKIDGVKWADTGRRKVRMWTDDYYNLFQIMKR